MKTLFSNGILTLDIDMISTLTMAILILLLGYGLRKKIKFLEKFCIPAPVIGGVLFAILALILKQNNIMSMKMDTTFQSPFMIAFFTTVGLGASFGLVKKGRLPLIFYWLLCGILSIMQNVIGVVFAKLTGISPLLGLMVGAVSMEGGHGGAAAFGPTVESLGIEGATTVAIAAATFGLISGGIIGGPIAKYLIDKNNLKPNVSSNQNSETFDEIAGTSEQKQITTHILMTHLAIITVCMSIGALASGWFAKTTGLVLPGYVGAMFVAVLFRNINDISNFDLTNVF
ncbi:hypothetical protein IZY60_03095 [Lutibacter sp. B2]|nr:hypothetical protein [Lutibacter sp. B2]